jgi:N-acetylneuraminate synthase
MDKAIMRRSIVSARKILANETISANDIAFKRPGGGIPPSDYDKVIGKIAQIDIENDTTININDLK